jgi:hypothetical protein
MWIVSGCAALLTATTQWIHTAAAVTVALGGTICLLLLLPPCANDALLPAPAVMLPLPMLLSTLLRPHLFLCPPRCLGSGLPSKPLNAAMYVPGGACTAALLVSVTLGKPHANQRPLQQR